MSNLRSKYAKFLTIILVLVIIAIFVLLGIVVYDVYKNKKIDDNAQLAIEEFDKKINNNKKVNKINTVTNTSIDDRLNQLDSDDEHSDDEQYDDEQYDDNDSSYYSDTSTRTYLAGYEVIGKINIPKTGINLPILDRATPESLGASVAKLYGVDLNDPGNVTIVGHNYRNGRFFSNNYDLSNGDEIIITDRLGVVVTYIIYDMYETVPTDGDYMIRDTGGYKEISLSTCNDDSSLRLIILAREQE